MKMDVVGNDCIAVIDGKIQGFEIEQAYIDELLESAGNSEKALVIYESAEDRSLSQKEGLSVVHVVTDPARLAARHVIEGMDELTSCEADFTFDEEGRLVGVDAVIEGTRTAGGITGQMTMQLTGKYFDYGTTVVPAFNAD